MRSRGGVKREVGSMEYDETAGQGARCVADVSSIAPNEKEKTPACAGWRPGLTWGGKMG